MQIHYLPEQVVTGETSDGKHVFTHIEEVQPLRKNNGLLWYGVWGWDQTPNLPYCKSQPYEPRSVFPAPDGMRVNTIVFPPGHAVRKTQAGPKTADDEYYDRIFAAQPPGGDRSRGGGMHSTDSIDFGFVFSGEITLVQGDGAEVVLRAGDVLVQNGALHAWRNDSDKDCMICFVVLGANRKTAG